MLQLIEQLKYINKIIKNKAIAYTISTVLPVTKAVFK